MTTKKRRKKPNPKKLNLLLLAAAPPPPFLISGCFLLSTQPRQHHLHPFLHAISPFFLPLSTAAPHSIFLHTSRCSPLTSFSFGFSFPSASSPTHGQADHYSSNNPSSPPKTDRPTLCLQFLLFPAVTAPPRAAAPSPSSRARHSGVISSSSPQR